MCLPSLTVPHLNFNLTYISSVKFQMEIQRICRRGFRSQTKNARAELLFCSLDLFLLRPRCRRRRDLREVRNLLFLPLISLSKRCMHNEVCGCKEILLLNVVGKSKSSRKFSLFLSLKQT